MINLLFVITTNTNMGDLAFCLEWVAELGRDNYQHAFVIDRAMQKFIHRDDTLFLFERDLHIKETILAAVSEFKADVILFASNSYWNIAGQKGAERGIWHDDILHLNIPIMAFDPLEGMTELYVKLWDRTISFPPVPDTVLSLRASPNLPLSPNIRHFRSLKRFEQITDHRKHEVFKYIDLDPKKKAVLFPLATNCYYDGRKMFFDYYSHIARLFQGITRKDVQFLAIVPERITEFDACKNVIQREHLPYDIFIDILKSSDMFLTDSGFTSSFLHAMSSSIPSVVLCNSYDSLASVPGGDNLKHKSFPGQSGGKYSFIFDRLYSYMAFPYGMVELFQHDEKLYGVKDCHCKVEVLETQMFPGKIEGLLFDENMQNPILEKCAEFKSRCMKIPSPASIIDEALSRPA